MNIKFLYLSTISLYLLLILSYFNVAKAAIKPGCIKTNHEKITVRPLCAVNLNVEGLEEKTIVWTIIGASGSATLSCFTGCANTVLTTLDATVTDYKVQLTGTPSAGCLDAVIGIIINPILEIKVTVEKVDALTANILPNPATTCFGATTTITANPSGGKAPYTYVWNNVGASTAQAITAGAGSYTVNVKDAYTVCAPVSVSTTVATIPLPVISNVAVTNATTCGGVGSVAITITGASGKYDVDLNGDGSIDLGGQTPSGVIINIISSAGTVVKNVMVRPTTPLNTGCVSLPFPINTLIGEPAAPVAPTVVSPINYCKGDVASALSAAGTGLLWYYPLATSPSTGGTPTPSTATAGNSSFFVTQTVSNCVSAQSEIKVVVSAKPNPLSFNNSPATTCGGVGQIVFKDLLPSTNYAVSYKKDGVLVSVTGGVNSTPAGDLPFPNIQKGVYTDVAIGQGICFYNYAGPITIGGPATPAAPTVTSPITYCKGASTSALAATGTGGTLLWYTSVMGTGVATPPIPSSASIGTTSYWVTQTISGCESNKAKIDVVISEGPTFTLSSTSPSCSVSVGTISLIGLLPSTNYTLSYIKDGGVATVATIPTNSSGVYTLTALGSGNYTAINVTLNSCTSASQSITLTAAANPAAPTVTSPITYCKGAATTALSAIGTGTFMWYTSLTGTTGSSTTAFIPSSASAGTTSYWVSQTVSGCESNRAKIDVVVSDVPTFTVSLTPTTTCSSTDGKAMLSGLAATTSYNVSYSVNGIAQTPTSFTTDATGKLTVSPLPAATYTNLIVSVPNGCSSPSSGPHVITSPSAPIISTATTAICADGVSTKTLVATPTGGTWAFGAGSTASIGNIAASTFTVGNIGGTANITYTVSGCTSTLSFSVSTRPIIAVSKADATICGGVGLANIAISNASGNYDVDLDGNGTYEYTNLPTAGGNISIPNLAVGSIIKNTQIKSVSTGCVSIQSIINTTIAPPAPPASTTVTTAICADGLSTRALAATPAGGVWTLGSGSTASIGTVGGTTFTVGTVGGTAILNYTVSGCSTTVSLPVSTPPNLTITNPSAVCTPATVDLTTATVTAGSSSGLTYTYFTNATATASLANPSAVAASSTYYIKGTNASSCSVVKPVVVSVNTTVTASAGVNQSICGNVVSLSGTATTSATTTWSASVAGTFSNANSLTSTFTPTVQPTSAVTITLNATAGNCSAAPSSITVAFGIKPVIDAGRDFSLCTNAITVNTQGTATPTNTPVVWTSLGTGGSFLNSSATLLAATYSPSTADKANGVRLVMTSTNASCNNADTVFVTFNATPTISAGQPISVCSDKKFVTLNPSIAPVNTPIKWSSSGTGYFSDSTVATARYYFSRLDSTNGSVTLSLVSRNTGNCNASSTVALTINSTPYISVLPNYGACSYTTTIALVRGTVLPSNTPVSWSGGGGTFDTPTAVNTNYQLSATDQANTTNPIYLILKSTAAGCVGIDTAIFRITPSIVPSAGANQTVCSDVSKISLNGSVPTATNIVWISNGGGGFSNPNALKPEYILSPADRSKTSLTFTISTTDFGTCNISRSVVVNLTPVPTIDAGPTELAVCKSSVRIPLLGIVVPSGTPVRWATSGNGIFVNATSSATNYTISNKDKNDSPIYLFLRSTNSTCNSKDSIKVTFANAPVVVAGVNVTKCANNANLQLAGSVSGSTNTGEWISNGGGSFIPDKNNLSAIYVPSAGDKTSGTAGVNIRLTSTNNGTCPSVSDEFKLTISPSPVVSVGSDRAMCANNKSIALSGAITGNTTTGVWSSTGDGAFSSTTINNPIYKLGAQDSIKGKATITYTSTNNGACSPESNSFVLTINPSPVVKAGGNQIVCDNITQVSLAATVSGGAITGVWSTNGNGGTFLNTTSLNTLYTPSNLDRKNGVVLTLSSTNNGICTASKDSVRITFSPSPVVDAGKDIVVCANVTIINIAGSITGAATAGVWKSLSATPGTFENANALSTIYTPSGFERANGSVVLSLTSTNNGSCNPSTDQINISFTSPPKVLVGANQSVCANATNISLNGSVVGESSTGIWTSSTAGGKFVPSNEALDAKYEPSGTDRTLQSITLTLTSTQNKSCAPVAGEMKVTFTSAPTADAGSDRSVCANNADIGLDGKITGATGGLWISNGDGKFLPNATTLNATYSPGKIDKENGKVTLTLTTTGNGTSCNESFAKTTITLTVPPKSDAGPDLVICKNDPTVQLNGKVIGGSGKGQWITGKGKFTPDNTSLNATYAPTDEDLTKGILMVLSSTNNQNCIPDRDTVKITFSEYPVNAGSDIITCSNNTSVDLAGSISGVGSTGLWTGGLGTFSPNANWNPSQTTVRTTYIPSAAERSSGIPVKLTLIAQKTPNINCPGLLNDFLLVTINPGPTVTVMNDKVVCSNTAEVPISGNISVATGGVWITGNGTGSFTPSNSDLNTNYKPSKKDIDDGLPIKLRLTSTGNGVCKAASETLSLSFTKLPIVSAGVNQTICSNVDSIPLNGIVNNVVGDVLWTTSGKGKFVPSANALKAYYLPSTEDLAIKKVDLTLATTSNAICGEVKDKITITFINAPAISAGKDTIVCTNAQTLQLNAKAIVGTSVIWSSSGKGEFSKPNILNPIYKFNQNDFTNIFITLTVASNSAGNCPSTKSVMKVTFAPKPTAYAGKDTSVCENSTAIKLNGKVQLASGGAWSSINGKGKFENANKLIATYIPDKADYTAGSVNITLTTTGNDYNCLAATNSLVVTFKKSPLVFAGKDAKVCSGDTVAALSGTITGTNNLAAQWTTLGTGTFVQGNNLLNTPYKFSNEDRAVGSVKLILKSLDQSLCKSIEDTITLTFTPLATVSAGNDIEICANQPINLKGTIQGGATKGKWFAGGSGKFKPNAEALNVTYLPSANDVAKGKIEISLTATDACAPVDDKMVLTFIPSPLVMAGASQSICEGSPEVTLNGMITDDGVIDSWKTLGSGTFAPDNKNLLVVYTIGTTDIANGKVKIVLSSMPTANCPGGTDTLEIKILKQPKANAGIDLTACSNGVVELNGSISGGAGKGRWQTLGTGIFLPADTLLNATYKPSAEDVLSGLVKLVLTSTNNSNCIASIDTLSLTINKSIGSIFDAGMNREICANGKVEIGGTSQAGFAYKWSPSEGLFDNLVSNPKVQFTTSPKNDTLYTYVVTVTETTSKCITKDTVLVTVHPKPLPVPIPNELILCGEAKVDIVYQVFGNTKSQFQWFINQGEIVAGQGTNNLSVNWSEGFGQKLSVVEISPNNCVSDTVKIILNTDNTGVVLKVVSHEAPYTGKGLKINWSYSVKNNIPKNVTLMRRAKLPVAETLFKSLTTIINADSSYVDMSIDTGAVYEYKIQYTNSCERSLETTTHNNIDLKFQSINDQSALLTWNPYNGWPNGVKAYEVWRKVDGNDSYTLIAEVKSTDATSYTLNDIFYRSQHYLIKAVGKNNNYESYSNEISLVKLVALNIPNAISPNDDNVNDKWIIDNINLYKENEVKIFNQWNSEVFSQKAYANNWDGAGLPDGTYYYIIQYGEKANRPTDKGFLLIVR